MTRKKKIKRVNLTPQQLLEREELKSLTRKYQAETKLGGLVDLEEDEGPNQICRVEPLLPKVNDEIRTTVQNTPKKKAEKNTSLLMTVTDLCQSLKLSRSTISRMDKSGALPGRVMVGGSVRYHRETIENWLRDTIQQGKGL